MSEGGWDQEHGAYQCPGPVLFFSNPLMSDGASDWSPVHDASFNGRPVALQALLSQGACANLATLDQVSPLLGACQRGHALCARLLIQSGAHVNSATLDGSTPLSEACAGGHLTCVSLLLQHGATPLGPGGHAPSPIHIAAAKGHRECVSVLVEHGADVDLHRDLSGTPLCAAVANQHLSTVRSLLQEGASVNSSLDGDSPLHTAARLSSPEMVSVLMEHGADCSVRNPQGKRPVDLAPPNSLAERMLGKSRGPCGCGVFLFGVMAEESEISQSGDQPGVTVARPLELDQGSPLPGLGLALSPQPSSAFSQRSVTFDLSGSDSYVLRVLLVFISEEEQEVRRSRK